MYVKVFREKELLPEYIRIAALSLDGFRAPPAWFVKELTDSFHYTAALPDDFRLARHKWILYGLYDDDGTLIGTSVLTEDIHAFDASAVDYVAVRKDLQGKGLGTFMIKEMLKETEKHSVLKALILSTSPDLLFYEKIGMRRIGAFSVTGHTRVFYAFDIPGRV